jgi:hypothetical protein
VFVYPSIELLSISEVFRLEKLAKQSPQHDSIGCPPTKKVASAINQESIF